MLRNTPTISLSTLILEIVKNWMQYLKNMIQKQSYTWQLSLMSIAQLMIHLILLKLMYLVHLTYWKQPVAIGKPVANLTHSVFIMSAPMRFLVASQLTPQLNSPKICPIVQEALTQPHKQVLTILFVLGTRPMASQVLTNCSNNYGPFHFPEKLVPVIILNGAAGKPLPIYGSGSNVRDWLYVEDHADALLGFEKGIVGRNYWSENELSPRVVEILCRILDRLKPLSKGSYSEPSNSTRPTRHDLRYAIDPTE